jgi:hypothetical protein
MPRLLPEGRGAHARGIDDNAFKVELSTIVENGLINGVRG